MTTTRHLDITATAPGPGAPATDEGELCRERTKQGAVTSVFVATSPTNTADRPTYYEDRGPEPSCPPSSRGTRGHAARAGPTAARKAVGRFGAADRIDSVNERATSLDLLHGGDVLSVVPRGGCVPWRVYCTIRCQDERRRRAGQHCRPIARRRTEARLHRSTCGLLHCGQSRSTYCGSAENFTQSATSRDAIG